MVAQPSDRAFRALANNHRRSLLLALLANNPQENVTLRDDTEVAGAEAEDLRTEFYHTHLPMLERMGFVEWDQETHTVITGPAFDEIRPLLELIDQHRDEFPDGWL